MASVRERTGKTGAATWAVLYRQGKRQLSKTFETAKAAEKWRDLVNLIGAEEALAHLDREQRPAGITLDQLAAQWMAAKERDVTPRVMTGYRRDYENWISPWLGNKEAASIDEADVQRLVDHMRKTLSPKSVADRHAILHQIYRWGSARSRSLVEHNPCKETELPRRVKTPPKGLRLPELHTLIETARRIDPEAADLIEFLANTGWRLGEAIALTAAQVDDDGTSVYVEMSRVWRREVGFTEGAKSSAGRRRLRVLGNGPAVLRRRLVGLGPGDLVFTTAKGRPWDESGFRRDHWSKIIAGAGLAERKPTPHWLRHTHVFICHAAGMSLAEIQRRIGHEDIKMTINVYGRMIEDMSDEVAARLDRLLTPAPAGEAVVQGDVVRGTLA